MDYRGVISKEIKKSVDCAFLGSVYPYDIHAFSFSSASSLLTKDTYLSKDNTFEDIHPSAFISKLQTHNQDSPTYKYIRKGSVTKREAWAKAMTKEFRYMSDLGSFEMVSRPKGAKQLQSTWDFKRKRFLGSTLRNYKACFCLRGYQQIDGLDNFDTVHPCSFLDYGSTSVDYFPRIQYSNSTGRLYK